MTDQPPVSTIAQVVGLNARRLRGTNTADDVARAARNLGLRWTTGRVSELESGRVSPTVQTLFALCQALQHVTGHPVSVLDLVRDDAYMEITNDLAVASSMIQEFLSGGVVHLKARDQYQGKERALAALKSAVEGLKHLPSRFDTDPVDFDAWERVASNSGETEQRIARDLGIDTVRMNAEQVTLWGDTFSAERDRRAGPDANPQKRGRISRVMKDELKASLAHGDD